MTAIIRGKAELLKGEVDTRHITSQGDLSDASRGDHRLSPADDAPTSLPSVIPDTSDVVPDPDLGPAYHKFSTSATGWAGGG